MTVSYFVHYADSHPLSEEFLDHYRKKHCAILRQFPGIESLHLHTAMPWQDGESVNGGETGLIAQMTFPSSEELNAALVSDARRLAREDFKRFPTYTGRVIHQAMASETVFDTSTTVRSNK